METNTSLSRSVRTRHRLHACLGIAALLIALAPAGIQAAPRQNTVSIIPTVTSIVLSNGQLLASGTATAVLHGQTNTVPFSGVPVTLALSSNQVGAAGCPILDLTLAPITLDLLGLVVETSPICLNITGYAAGGLLGDLLCNVANLLNGGLNLNQILSGLGLPGLPGLTPAQLTTLLSGVQTLLNGALDNLLQSVLTSITPGHGLVCGVLHLELGPVTLNLLGLQVDLDNCANGPVVVDITAHRGQGNLLGNLLCGGLSAVLGNTLQQVLGDIGGLLNH